MNNLLLILLLVFAAVALMVVLGERFASPMDPEQMRKVQRWIMPLVGISIVLGLARFYWPA